MKVRRIRSEDRERVEATPGMEREDAVALPGVWSGVVRLRPGVPSGWHHHDGHETVAYVLEGVLRVEFGPGGEEEVDVERGEFVHIPARVVHRETGIGEGATSLVAFRAGDGELVVNLEGPYAG